MTKRLSDRQVEERTIYVDGPIVNSHTTVMLAREVQAARKLRADLLALHVGGHGEPGMYCKSCGFQHPCPTVRLLEADDE